MKTYYAVVNVSGKNNGVWTCGHLHDTRDAARQSIRDTLEANIERWKHANGCDRAVNVSEVSVDHLVVYKMEPLYAPVTYSKGVSLEFRLVVKEES